MSKGTILYVGGFELPDKNAAAHRVLSNGKIIRNLDYRLVFLGIDKSLEYVKNFQLSKRKIQNFECWSSPYPKKYFDWFKYLSSINQIMVPLQKG